MILKCPECSTRFLVPDSAFGTTPRRVRCGKCKHDWMAEPPAPPEPKPVVETDPLTDRPLDAPAAESRPAAPAPTPEPEITPPPAEPAPIPEGSNLPVAVSDRTVLMRGLMALAALLLIALLGGAWLYATATGGKLLSSEPAAPQLAIEDVKTRYVEVLPAGADTMPAEQAATLPKSWALVVEGTIRNKSEDQVALPQLILATKDSNGALINLYRPNVQMSSLPANGVTGFTYTLNDVSDRVAEVTVQFGSDNGPDLIQPSGAKPEDKAPPAEPADHGGH